MMADDRQDVTAPPEAYAIEIIGTLPRRDAEALRMQIKELARRHHLKVIGAKVQPVGSTGTD